MLHDLGRKNDNLVIFLHNYRYLCTQKRARNLHPYQFCVFEDEMQEIIKTYTYAYSGEEI